MMLDCEFLVEQEYSFTATRGAAMRALLGKHSWSPQNHHRLNVYEVGGSLKTTIVSPSSLRAGFDASAATAVWVSLEAYRLLGVNFRMTVSAVSAMPGSTVDSGSCVRVRKILNDGGLGS